MSELNAKFKDSVFVVTENVNCPFYFKGDEMEVKSGAFTLTKGGGTCLILAADIAGIVSFDQPVTKKGSHLPKQVQHQGEFQCSGCRGFIKFTHKQSSQYMTGQMKILAEAQQNAKINEARVYFNTLRKIELFSVLNDEELMETGKMLEFEELPWQFPIVEQGAPGDRLIVLLEGKVEMIDEQGNVLEELEEGGVIGEMSLISGERVSRTVMTVTPCRIGTLDKNDFKTVKNRFPVLQEHFHKILVNRYHKRSERHEQAVFTSGMTGQLIDISAVELCQMINSNRKSGQLLLDFDHDDGSMTTGRVIFKEGEIIGACHTYSRENQEDGKNAFFKMLAMSKGRFQFIPTLTPKQQQLKPIGGFAGLIMEGVQYIDDMNA